MAVRPSFLLRLLDRARMITLRRELAMALVIASAGVVVIGALALVATALTLRGDRVAPLAAACAVAILLGALVQALRRYRSRAGGRLRMARTLAAETRSPLPAAARADILGAVETWWLLGGRGEGPGHVASTDLAEAYVQRTDERMRRLNRQSPLPPLRPQLLVPPALALAFAGLVLIPPAIREAAPLLLAGIDGRPQPPPAPLWSSLSLTLTYPPHTGRTPRRVENPSGALRLPLGTQLALTLQPQPGSAGLVLLVHRDQGSLGDPAPQVRPLEASGDGRLGVAFTVESPGAWSIAATVRGVQQSSPPYPLEIEPDAAPEVELLPLPSGARSPSELDTVELRFRARDDFGFAAAELVIARGDDETRLDVGAPPGRSWNHRYRWDLSQMPLEERTELEYWIEVRDNDPLRATPTAARPGKVTRSTRMRLSLRDREAEHAANIEGLRELRDAAVDHLAARMMTPAFERDGERSPIARLDEARSLHAAAGDLLAALATMLDRLAVDQLTRERDTTLLGAVHGRLRPIFVDEQRLHERVPVGAAIDAPGRARSLLASLVGVNDRMIRQLEDEIIRLDDLVDNQIVARIEALVARIEASQRKLVELLERLKAGDRSVLPQIEQLQARLREDLRRVQDARAQLQKEVDREFLNLDAFQAIQARMEHEDLDERLRRGDVDGALERARERLDELRGLRDSVQQRLANAPSAQLSPQERARIKLLRELSRLQDNERGVEGESRGVHQRWRDAVGERELPSAEAEAIRKTASQLQRRLEGVNDAHLSREGRDAVGDALEELSRLATAGNALEAQESAAKLAEALRAATDGAKPGELEAKALAKLRDAAAKLRERTAGALPQPHDLLDGPEAQRLAELGQRQSGIETRARELLELPESEHLPEAGASALKRAASSLQRSAGALRERRTGEALSAEAEAIRAIQEAIDALRKTSTPPSGGSDQASTETERDRSLRDEVVEAMREEAPEGYAEPVKRYYEELLR
ncbi:MAG: DUF4175 family protein [Nannocystaceae bacterium]